jgi:ribosomal protein S18 acetylase RimI-like enzyme
MIGKKVDAKDEPHFERVLAMMDSFNRFEGIAWTPQAGRGPLTRLVEDATLGVVCTLHPTDAPNASPLGYFVVTWGYDLEWGGRDAFLTELWLEPDARGRGLGREALALVEETARRAGARALHVLVRHENAVARRLYDGAGFTSPPRAFLSKTLT